MAGFLSNGICWPDIQQATDAHFQKVQPAFFLNGANTSHHYYLRSDSGVWSYVQDINTPDGLLFSRAVQPLPIQHFATCEVTNDPTSNFLTGMELGWAVAGVMVIVFAIRRSYRGF